MHLISILSLTNIYSFLFKNQLNVKFIPYCRLIKQHHLPSENYCISEGTSVQLYYDMINRHFFTLTSLSRLVCKLQPKEFVQTEYTGMLCLQNEIPLLSNWPYESPARAIGTSHQDSHFHWKVLHQYLSYKDMLHKVAFFIRKSNITSL